MTTNVWVEQVSPNYSIFYSHNVLFVFLATSRGTAKSVIWQLAKFLAFPSNMNTPFARFGAAKCKVISLANPRVRIMPICAQHLALQLKTFHPLLAKWPCWPRCPLWSLCSGHWYMCIGFALMRQPVGRTTTRNS